MVQKTNTIETQAASTEEVFSHASQVGQDLKTSVLIISVLMNTVILIAWVLLQVTSQYDSQLASLIFSR